MPDIKYFSNVQSKSTGDVYVVKDEGAREQIDDIYKYNGEMGAKNLIPYPYHDTTKTAKNVTFTDNGDGTVTVSTESGGATGDVTFDFIWTTEFTVDNSPLKVGESYILNCENINSTASGYRIRMYIKDSNLSLLLSKAIYTSEDFEFELPSGTFGINVQIFIPSGTVLSTPFTFKPMLRLASDTDNTYQPYAKTNRQLTEDVSVPKYNSTGEYIYYEGGDQFTGKIDSTPTAGSANAVSSGGTKTYVDSAIAGVSISGQYAECSTARNVTAKTVTLAGFELKTGSRISVRFTDTGSSNPASGHITLNVNGTGAKEIVDGHTNMTILGDTSGGLFYNNIVNDFIYDGTYWVYMNRDNNTTYSSKAAASGGTATSLCTTGEKYTWNNKQNALTFDNIPTQNSNNPVKSGGIFSTMAVPKYDAANRREYFEGGAAFDGNIDSSPTAGSNNAVSSGGTKAYVDSLIAYQECTLNNSDSIAANSYKQFNIDITKSGYTPIGVMGFSGSGTGKLAVMEFYIASATTAVVYLTNSTSAAITPTQMKVKILYIKS